MSDVKLTQEQIDSIPGFIQMVLDMCRSTEPVDDALAIQTVKELYTAFGYDEPEVLMFDDPKQCLEAIGHYESLWFSGGSEGYWIAVYRFAREYCGVDYGEDNPKLDAWWKYIQYCGPAYLFESKAYLSRRPNKLHVNADGQLHNESDYAMQFPSGWGLTAFNGTLLPNHWVLDKDNIDLSEVLKERDVEVRAAGAQCIGWARFLDKVPNKVIHDSGDPDIGKLIEITLPGLNEPGLFLMAECPRNGTIVEGVPRVNELDGKPIRTAIAAQAWSFGLTEDDFTPPSLST